MTYTTDYESIFPSGFMTPNIQAERRQDSPATVAAARSYNRHDVEILRIQETIGVTPTPSGQPNPNGDILSILYQNYQDITNIISHGSGLAANKIAFHDDSTNTNYQFIEWLLDWMGIWDDLSAGGTPSITEITKALWNNKYDLEVLLEPKFMYPAERWWNGLNPDEFFFKYTADGTEGYVNCGHLSISPKKPIGGGCNLNNRPWPVYDVYCETCGQFYEGHIPFTSGHVLRFYTNPTNGVSGLGPDAAMIDTSHLVGLFGNSPVAYASQPSGYVPAPVTSLFPPPPTPTLDPPPPWPPWPTGGVPVPTGDPVPPTDNPVEVDKWLIDPGFDAYVNHEGVMGIAPVNMFTGRPVAYDGDPLALTQITGSWMYGVDISAGVAQIAIPLVPGWNFIFAVMTIGANLGPFTSSDWHCYISPMPFGDFQTAQVWPPTEHDFAVPTVTLNTGEYKVIPIGYTFAEAGGAGMALVSLSDEGENPPVWCVAIGTRGYSSVLSGMV